jgi:hypothetical protein
VKRIGELGTLAVTSNWKYLAKKYFPPKRRFLQEPHGVTSQKTAELKSPGLIIKQYGICVLSTVLVMILGRVSICTLSGVKVNVFELNDWSLHFYDPCTLPWLVTLQKNRSALQCAFADIQWDSLGLNCHCACSILTCDVMMGNPHHNHDTPECVCSLMFSECSKVNLIENSLSSNTSKAQ